MSRRPLSSAGAPAGASSFSVSSAHRALRLGSVLAPLVPLLLSAAIQQAYAVTVNDSGTAGTPGSNGATPGAAGGA
ncbi:hypothetical protein, partial [Ideonella azotifigens]